MRLCDGLLIAALFCLAVASGCEKRVRAAKGRRKPAPARVAMQGQGEAALPAKAAPARAETASPDAVAVETPTTQPAAAAVTGDQPTTRPAGDTQTTEEKIAGLSDVRKEVKELSTMAISLRTALLRANLNASGGEEKP